MKKVVLLTVSTCPSGSKPGILYGQAKVHKPVKENCPPFHPIMFTIGTRSYDWAIFLISTLKLLNENEYTAQYSFSFSKKLVNLTLIV